MSTEQAEGERNFQRREEDDRRDIQIINRQAERLNREAIDALEYQQIDIGQSRPRDMMAR